MSRSFSRKRRVEAARKVSERSDKKIWHGTYRKAISIELTTQIKNEDEIVFSKIEEHSEPWTMRKETKKPHYIVRSQTRKEIDSLLGTIANQGKVFHNDYLLAAMAKYFKTDDPNALLIIPSGKIRLFVNDYMKKIRRK
jgi:DNA-binding response OmpR family regulator